MCGRRLPSGHSPARQRSAAFEPGPELALPGHVASGRLEPTGRIPDLAVDGRGLFVLEGDRERLYTRIGRFETDSEAQLRDTYGRLFLASPFEFPDRDEADIERLVPVDLSNIPLPPRATRVA